MSARADRGQEYEERLQAFTGRRIVDRRTGRDPVNVPMIRQWIEAMGMQPSVHLDATLAREAGRRDVVAPAAMTQTWTMRGYAATVRPDASEPSPADELVGLLEEGGYTSVVATDSDFAFHRELMPGEVVSVDELVESISAEKRTALGSGRFVTTVRTYTDADGVPVAVQRWRTLRFAPQEPDGPATRMTEQER